MGCELDCGGSGEVDDGTGVGGIGPSVGEGLSGGWFPPGGSSDTGWGVDDLSCTSPATAPFVSAADGGSWEGLVKAAMAALMSAGHTVVFA